MLNINTEVHDGSEYHTQLKMRVDSGNVLLTATVFKLGIYQKSYQFHGLVSDYNSQPCEELLAEVSESLKGFTLGLIEGAFRSNSVVA